MRESTANIEVIYENNDFVEVNKPAGLITHPASLKKEEPSLSGWAREHYPCIAGVGDAPEIRPGVVHRLDKDTSGIILLAKNQTYFNYLKKQFQERSVAKSYLAWVCGSPKAKRGSVDLPIGIKSGSVKRSVHSFKMSKPALTEYEVRKKAEINGLEYALLLVRPRTGRTHQIRVHLASIGHPVVGDVLYGGRRAGRGGRLLLHALSLELELQPGRRLMLAADPPPDFKPG